MSRKTISRSLIQNEWLGRYTRISGLHVTRENPYRQKQYWLHSGRPRGLEDWTSDAGRGAPALGLRGLWPAGPWKYWLSPWVLLQCSSLQFGTEVRNFLLPQPPWLQCLLNPARLPGGSSLLWHDPLPTQHEQSPCSRAGNSTYPSSIVCVTAVLSFTSTRHKPHCDVITFLLADAFYVNLERKVIVSFFLIHLPYLIFFIP